MKKIGSTILLCIIILAFIAACSGDSKTQSESETTTTQPVIADAPTPSSTSATEEKTESQFEGSIIGSWENTGDSSNDEEGFSQIIFTSDGRYEFFSAIESKEGTFGILGNDALIRGDDTPQVVLVKIGILISHPDSGGGDTLSRFEIEDDVLTFGGVDYKRVD